MYTIAMSTTPVIKVSHGTKNFGAFTALDRISFQVQPGEVVGFVGANGAGKTTTIGLLLGFIGPSAGEVHVFGTPVMPSNAHRLHSRIGYAAGDMQLPPRLTGRQYLSLVLHHAATDQAVRYADLCQRFQPELGKKIGELSRGNKQKIALIAAFVNDPELIVLDEPTSGLDPVMQAVFLQLVQEARQQGRTVFMSSHYLQEVAEVCTRVIMMRHGVIIHDARAEAFLEGSGKQVRIVTRFKNTRPPKGASDISTATTDQGMALTFVYKGAMGDLQRWLAAAKQVEDIEVSEYNLSGAFSSLYEAEEARQ